jgi:hypothetical protein
MNRIIFIDTFVQLYVHSLGCIYIGCSWYYFWTGFTVHFAVTYIPFTTSRRPKFAYHLESSLSIINKRMLDVCGMPYNLKIPRISSNCKCQAWAGHSIPPVTVKIFSGFAIFLSPLGNKIFSIVGSNSTSSFPQLIPMAGT